MTRERAAELLSDVTVLDDPEMEEAHKMAISALRKQEHRCPCDLCNFGPPSSMRGKPCTMCPAIPKQESVTNRNGLNEPLTLDELRKMDGEPVWVRSIDGDGKDIWAFVDTDCEMVRIFVTRSSVKCMVTLRHFKTYGKSWLAYRQKPEEDSSND